MRQLSLFWKLYLSYLLVIVLALLMVVLGSYAVQGFQVLSLTQPVVDLAPQPYLNAQSIILGGCLLVLLAAAPGLFTSRRISQPLQAMRRGAERFAAAIAELGQPQAFDADQALMLVREAGGSGSLA